MQKKILALFAALIALVCLLCACAGNGDGTQTSTDPAPSVTTPQEGEGTTTPAAQSRIMLADLANYSVVRPETTSDSVKESTLRVYRKLGELGVKTIKTDFIVTDRPGSKLVESDYEILVGNTNRKETEAATAGLRIDDYGYSLIGTKIVIFGGDDEAIDRAARAFIENVIGKVGDDGVFMDETQNTLVLGQYNVDSMSLAGTDISDYRIVYAGSGVRYGDKELAAALGESVTRATGYVLDVVSDRAEYNGGKEILVGKTNRDVGGAYDKTLENNGYYLGSTGNFVLMFGNSSLALASAVRDFTNMMDDATFPGGNATLDVGERLASVPETDKLTAMSFNVWVSGRTTARDERVITMVLNYMPDTVGFQEAAPAWMSVLKQKLGRYYNYVGEGRDGGDNGEYNPIFYRKDKFTLLEYGTKWLSDTPDSVSRYAESSLNRIYTYAKLQRISDGAVFLHINTHFDHKSGDARLKQARVLIDFVKKNTGIPMIISGDFNSTPGAAPYNAIISGGLASSSEVARLTEKVYTFHNYGSSDKTLDYIFVMPQSIIVDRYHVCNEKIKDDYASDHHPVFIEYYIVN